jgi:Fe-S-cluster containining protein
MAPWEVKEASTLLNTSMEHFIATYASHTLQDDSDGEFWVRLQNTKEQACVFLSSENQCRIYQARPAQCRAYPFWPNILASQESWNDEVRLLDTETGASDQSIPYWTPELGGCEGMQRLQPTDISLSSGVPMQEVELQLQDYEFHDRRFPRAGTPVVPVGDNTEDPF